MKNWTNSLFSAYYKQRYRQITRMIEHPHELQAAVFQDLISSARRTKWGKQFDYASINSPSEFAQRVPLQDYEDLKPYINRMMHGEPNVLWKGKVNWFSKSSGTTNDKSKYIPVSKENFRKCHIKGTWDTMTLFYHHYPESKIFGGKNFLLGGTHDPFPAYPESRIGDVSALMIEHMPIVAKPFFVPAFEIALLKDYEKKIELLAQTAIADNARDQITMIGGVPTWVIVLFRRILEITGKSNMLEVWPNFECYIHGGVSFEPYREQLQHFFPSPKVAYHEVYNASEGYLAVQLDKENEGMLLLLDNGVYYEFLPMEEWGKKDAQTIPLEAVEVGKNYALVISTNGGLWRYMIGDTVSFTSTYPYRIKITGRTQQFINTFGEEVMVSNTDKALAKTCSALNASVVEYTVAPIYFSGTEKGGHEWLIEFEKAPTDLDLFTNLLDENLQKINSDYEAKRYKNMALNRLQVHSLAKDTFLNWLRHKGKYHNQSKIPRLANHRNYVEDILSFEGEMI